MCFDLAWENVVEDWSTLQIKFILLISGNGVEEVGLSDLTVCQAKYSKEHWMSEITLLRCLLMGGKCEK